MDATRSLLVVLAIQLALAGAGWWISAVLLGLSRAAGRHWSAFCLLGVVAALSGLLETGPRHALPVAVSNLAVAAAFVTVVRGVNLFLGRRPGWWFDLAAVVAVALVGAVDLFTGVNPYLRAALVSGLVAAVLVRGAATSWRLVRAEFGSGLAVLVSGPMVLAALLFAWRVLSSGWLPHDEQVLLMTADSIGNWLALLALTSMCMLFNLSLAYMVVMRLVRRLQHLSRHDSLTGLMNRRALLASLEAEQGRVRRGAQGWALLLLDVDHFKRINDEHGHASGDEVLRQIGRALREASREVDTVARMGGEEFCVLAPLTDLHGAALLAERLRRAVTDEATLPGLPPVTISVGVALSLPGSRESVEEAVARADVALYKAKAAGRDRVEFEGGA